MTSHKFKEFSVFDIGSFFAISYIVGGQFFNAVSGVPQYTTYLLVPALIALCLNFIKEGFTPYFFGAYSKVFRWSSALWLAVFVPSAVALLHYSEIEYAQATVYLTFNLAVLFGLATCFLNSAISLSLIRNFAVAAVLAAFSFKVLGLGEMWDGLRYKGFHNDPNQLTNYLLCVVAIVGLTTSGKLFTKIVVISAATIVILSTASRSGQLGLVVLWSVFLVELIKYISGTNDFISIRNVLIVIALLLVFAFIGYEVIDASQLRILNVLPVIEYELNVRGYMRAVEFPQWMILGSGWGGDARFGAYGHYEIHSTFLAFAFYSGIAGLVTFVGLLVSILRPLPVFQLLYVLPVFVYSLTTYNARNPIFWVMLAVAFTITLRMSKKYEDS